jgi:serine/threonine protein phosphatase PrpC
VVVIQPRVVIDDGGNPRRQQAVAGLVELALQHGGPYNVTVIVVDVPTHI